jgi:methyl-accepting chemotaxis protein
MALVKTSALNPKSAQAPLKPVPGAQPVPDRDKVASAQRRARDRTRQKQEKAAERIAAATEELAAGVTQAAAASEELRRSLEQIAAAAEEAAGAAHESNAAVNGLAPIFAQGRTEAETSRSKAESLQGLLVDAGMQIEALVTAVQDNSARQLRSVEVVATLESQAGNISDITRVVGDISDQTNLLALNAAIEAARAGDHGRGFSVVADEVRAFAESSERSAREVQGLADAIATEVRAIASRIKSSAELSQLEAESGLNVITALNVIRSDMLMISQGSLAILIATQSAEAGAREAQRGAEMVASAAEQQSSATVEAQQAVEQQSKALDQSQQTAQALAELAESLQSDQTTATSTEQLASAAEELSATVQELSSAATQILTAIDQISLGAQSQASASQQSSAAMTQIENAATGIRTAAEQARDRIAALEPKIAGNAEAVAKLSTAIAAATEETLAVGTILGNLEASGKRIEKIVDGIALIAVQTNMLAVSGSVEAARAREFGRGFAVVSSDIRNLSRQSAENAGRAKDVATAIQGQIVAVRRDLELAASASQVEIRKNRAVIDRLKAVQSELQVLGRGSAELLQASDGILSAVRLVLTGIQQIAAASEEAGRAGAQAATAARQQAQGAEDLAAAIEEIAGLADELQNAKS